MIQIHNNRPTLFRDGSPFPIVAYSPVDYRRREMAQTQTARFFGAGLTAYFLHLPGVAAAGEGRFFDTPFWNGDTVSNQPLEAQSGSLDEQAQFILASEPDAKFIVRFGAHEPKSWRDKYPDELFTRADGEILPCPSLASALYSSHAARLARAAIEHSQGHDWADKIIGYANFLRMEGTHEPTLSGDLFDHCAPMLERWRALTDEPLPSDWNEFAGGLYFGNAPLLRLYFQLSRDLFHQHFRALCAAMDDARGGRDQFLVYDALKINMMGWNNPGFFDANYSWPAHWPEDRATSGHMGVAQLFEARGFDGLITPHDYQARGLGGVYEPEGIADSCILRGKLFLCEMDTRTRAGNDVNFPARDVKEFEAISWRNWATSWTRGFDSYPMDVYEDWFAPQFQPTLKRQIEVAREAGQWNHATFPGIAVILDDEAVWETNGSGHVFNETIMWEPKLGLAHCGVPVRTYLFDDLTLDNWPAHRVFYFPNLYRADEKRLAILRERVFKNGHVVIWGAGSGISDGTNIGTEVARQLTGFEFEMWNINHPRRAIGRDFSHPLMQGLSGEIWGGPLAFGPLLCPTNGQSLANAWISGGHDASALSVLERDGWRSVFAISTAFSARFWRNAARWAGAHIWCDTDDVTLANSSLVALHSVTSGPKTLHLPKAADVYDVCNGALWARDCRTLKFSLNAPQTRVFRMESARQSPSAPPFLSA